MKKLVLLLLTTLLFTAILVQAQTENKKQPRESIPAVVEHIEEKPGKFLGLFNIQTRYEATVNPETGEVQEWQGPWWAFLITGETEKPPIIEKEKLVYNFETCVRKTGISTDSIPSECTYNGETYTEQLGGLPTPPIPTGKEETPKKEEQTLGPEKLILLGQTEKIGDYTIELVTFSEEEVGFKIHYTNLIPQKTGELKIGDTYSNPGYSKTMRFKLVDIYSDETIKAATIQILVDDYFSCKFSGYTYGKDQDTQKEWCQTPTGYRYYPPQPEYTTKMRADFNSCEANGGKIDRENIQEITCTLNGKIYTNKEYTGTGTIEELCTQIGATYDKTTFKCTDENNVLYVSPAN